MILFLESDGKIKHTNTFLTDEDAECEAKRCAWMGAYLYAGEYNFEADRREGYKETHYFDKNSESIHVEYTAIEPEPEEPLSETEQAILQTAITTEYTAALVEMMI